MPENQIFSPELPQKVNQPLFLTGLKGYGDSLAIASAIKNENRLFVIATPDNQTALRLEHELSFFLNDDYPILYFPDWETSPYEVFSPLPEIISERLKTRTKSHGFKYKIWMETRNALGFHDPKFHWISLMLIYNRLTRKMGLVEKPLFRL